MNITEKIDTYITEVVMPKGKFTKVIQDIVQQVGDKGLDKDNKFWKVIDKWEMEIFSQKPGQQGDEPLDHVLWGFHKGSPADWRSFIADMKKFGIQI